MAVQISGNDITVPRDTTVTRNLTVGGVLTYEDVTNVDSIGIVTARAGVLVGSGITLSKDGDIFATVSPHQLHFLVILVVVRYQEPQELLQAM